MTENHGRVDMAMRVSFSTPGNEYLLDLQKRLNIEKAGRAPCIVSEHDSKKKGYELL
jgi:hypothetical protein